MATSNSYSYPVITQTPQSEWSLTLSHINEMLAQSMTNWADTQFNNGMTITNGNIQQFLDQAGQARGFAENLLGRYQSTFEPLMDQYISKAQSWSSEGRRRFNMGAAESQVNQADEAAMNNLKRNLTEAGININSGVYQELQQKAQLDRAKQMAAAGTQASLDTEKQGDQMLQTAVQMGQNVPGMWATAANTRMSAINAAEQALTSMLNTGANMKNVGANYANAATRMMPPAQGNVSGSNSTGDGGGGMKSNPSGESGGRGNGRQTAAPSRDFEQTSPTKGYNPMGSGGQQQPQQSARPQVSPQGGMGTGKVIPIPPEQGTGDKPYDEDNKGSPPVIPADGKQTGTVDPVTGEPIDPDTGLPMVETPDRYGQSGSENDSLPEDNPDNPDFAQPWNDSIKDYDYSQPETAASGGDTSGWDESGGWDPSSWGGDQTDYGGDTGGWDGGDQTDYGGGGWDGGNQGGYDYSGGDYNGDSGNGWDASGGNGWDASGGGDYNGDTSGYDQGNQGGYDQGNQGGDYGGGDYGGYRKGGNVRPRPQQRQQRRAQGVLPTTGGHVPRSASPTRGRVTDDIPARLNADEYVIPKDVVKHFGTKHFDKLIEQSRKLRTGMAGPAPKPTRKPALRMKPTFVSRYMGQ